MKIRATCGLVRSLTTASLLVVALAAAGASGDSSLESANLSRRILAADADGTNWAAYGRTYDENHFSPLTQLDERSVTGLGLVWAMDLPVSVGAVTAPLAVDGILYVAAGLSVVRAIDAISGRELWHYDPDVTAVAGDTLKTGWGIRGLAWWQGRLFVGTQDGRLIAIEAKTGKLVWSVHSTARDDGRYITGVPRVFDGKVIIGNSGGDESPVRGYVTAYAADTGKQLWRFYTVPGDPAHGFENAAMAKAADTWKGQWWKFGGGGMVWNAITYDPDYKRIYIGTGNGMPWNQKIRSPGGGDNLFLSSIVALDAETGAYVWHYQTTPGDMWDFDSATDMELATLNIDGKAHRVILHAPKNGFFYVIDRENGKLISAQPFTKVTWASHVDLATGRPIEDPAARLPEGSSLVWPGGASGAHSWHPMSFSPKTGLVYIPTIDLPGQYSDRTINPATWLPEPRMVFNSGFDVVTDFGDGLPVGQSLSRIQAWDPIRQREAWSVALPGVYNGGIMSTAGNLVFQGRSDGRFVAYAAGTGKVLWSFNARDAVLAQPITYLAQGRQFVTVIASFGGPPTSWGPLSSQFNWDYYTQQRRVLTFAAGGKFELPPAPPRSTRMPVRDIEFVSNPAVERRGAVTFAQMCTACHGMAAIAGGGAPDLRQSNALISSVAFRSIVHDGVLQSLGMPKFDNITEQGREELRQYLRNQAQVAQK